MNTSPLLALVLAVLVGLVVYLLGAGIVLAIVVALLVVVVLALRPFR